MRDVKILHRKLLPTLHIKPYRDIKRQKVPRANKFIEIQNFCHIFLWQLVVHQFVTKLTEFDRFFLAFSKDFIKYTLTSSIFELQKCYLYQNGVAFHQELIGLLYSHARAGTLKLEPALLR